MDVRAVSRRAVGGELTPEAYGGGRRRFRANPNETRSPGPDPVPASDHLVQEGDRRAVASLAIGLQLRVPGRPEQLGEAVLELVGAAGAPHEAAQPLLADDDVAVRRHQAAVEPAAGDVGQPFAVAGRRALLGDLEDEHRPGAQGGGELRGGAKRGDPRDLGPWGRWGYRPAGPQLAGGPAQN